MVNSNTIGTRLKTLRKDILNQTQEAFSRVLRIDRSHVANLEKDNKHPSESLIRLICLEFSVSETWLKTGEGEIFVSLEDDFMRRIACLGQQAVIDAFLNVMKECSLGITALQQFHRPGPNDPDLNRMISILQDIWMAGDEKLKGWAAVQFDRAFPADVVEEVQKKQKETYGQASTG